MPWTHGAFAAVASGNITPGLPPLTAANDLLVGLIAGRGSGATSLPATYADIANYSTGGGIGGARLVWKIAGPGETAPTFAAGPSGGYARLSRKPAGEFDPLDPIGAVTGWNDPGAGADVGTAVALSAVAELAGSDLLCAFWLGNDYDAVTTPAGMTLEYLDESTAGNDATIGLFTEVLAAAGATGNRSVAFDSNLTAAARYAAMLVEIRPAPDGGTFLDAAGTLALDVDTTAAAALELHAAAVLPLDVDVLAAPRAELRAAGVLELDVDLLGQARAELAAAGVLGVDVDLTAAAGLVADVAGVLELDVDLIATPDANYLDAAGVLGLDVDLGAAAALRADAAGTLALDVDLTAAAAATLQAAGALALDVDLAAAARLELAAAAILALDVDLAAAAALELHAAGVLELDVDLLLDATFTGGILDAAGTLALAVELVARAVLDGGPRGPGHRDPALAGGAAAVHVGHRLLVSTGGSGSGSPGSVNPSPPGRRV